MSPELLAVLCRERRRAVAEEYANGDLLAPAMRALTARSLRALGERLFRLGVALDEQVTSNPVAESRV